MPNSIVPAGFPDRKSAEFRERPLAAKPVSGIFIVVLMMGTIFVNMSGTAIVQAAPNGPLRVHPTNPIYFTDNSGKAIRLGGHQIFNDMQDHTFSSRYTYNYATTLDWNWYLNFATARNINYIRGWTLFSFGRGATASDPAIYTQPLPYARTGPGTAIDGRPKFDLNTFNQAFFDQMYSRINSAGQRGIYVSIMLFDVFNFLNNGRTRPNSMWDGNPYYSANNINSINTDTDGDGNGTEFFTTTNQTWLNYQKAYIRKVIDTVNSLDNVIYEVANEVTSPAWQEEIVAYIKTYEAGKPKQHLILRSPGTQNVGGDQEFEAKTSVLNSAAQIYAIANWGETNNTVGRPGIWDMDHTVPGSTDHKFPWKALTRGYHFNLYDAPFEDPAQESAAWERVRYNVRATNTYAGRFNNLAAMIPQSNLASTSYCLADAGNEYIVFQPDSSSSFTVYGLIPGRQYSYEWFNTSTYSVTGTGNVTPSGSSYSFTPSYTGAVLYLRSSAMISVAAPNSGEIWPIGSTRTVTWSSTGSVGNVDIELSTDGGSSWRPALATNTANDGSQAIVVPDAFSKTCRMRVKQNSGGSPADTSDANFTITLGGDATLDGYVDGLDFSILLTNWHTSGKNFTTGDFTGDGYVDGLDFSILLTNWHVRATLAGNAAPAASGGQSLSSPASGSADEASTTSARTIKVNFQPASTDSPAGYLVDGGLVFGDRGNGYSYGWASANVTAVDRNSSASADQRYDTMVNLPAGGAWEIALPNGQYSVKLVCGDAGSTGTYKVNIETVPVVDAQTSNLKRWIEQSIAVVVSDGRLTISGAPGCSRAKICFVEITGQ